MVIRWILVILGVVSVFGILLIQWWDMKRMKEQDKINQKEYKFLKWFSFKKKEELQNDWLYEYNNYPMGKGEKLTLIIVVGIVLYIVGYIFYQSPVGALLLTPFSLFYPSYRRKEKIHLQKKQLNLEFKEALYVITSSLTAGKSLETAIKDGVKELELLYLNNEAFIIDELRYITRKIDMNETVEEAFKAFAQRSYIEDIENFADVLITCKRTGGNLVEVMKSTSKIITEKIEFQQELDLMLSKRKFEQRFLNIFPVAMVLILSRSASNYMAPVFDTIIGRIVMTVAIVLFGVSMFITKKIIKIEV